MHPILQWGLDVIDALQSLGDPVMDALARGVSFLGTELFFLLALPFFLWCVDFGGGVRLAYFTLLSQYVNVAAKDLLMMPRPPHYRPGIERAHHSGYGLPSGHSQSTAVFWGGFAAMAGKPRTWIWAAVLILLVGLSRVYLGVHFPTDVLAGWGIAAVLLVVFFAVMPALEKNLARLALLWRIVLAFGVPILLALTHPVKDVVGGLAPLAGLGAGAAIFLNRWSFEAKGPWWQRIARYLLGIMALAVLYFGLSAVFPREGEAFYLPLRFLRYALVGLWAGLGAPWVFLKLRLAD